MAIYSPIEERLIQLEKNGLPNGNGAGGGDVKTIKTTDWTLVNGEYQYTFKHTLNTENLTVEMIDVATKEPMQPIYKIIDNANILIKSSANKEIKVVLISFSGGINTKDEVISSRTDKTTGQIYDNLGARMDATSSQLAEIGQQKANDSEVRKKSIPITERDISDTLKQQINGNAPILQTIGDSTVGLIKTTFKKIVGNYINKNTNKTGFYISYTTGLEVASASYGCTDFIEIEPLTKYSNFVVYPQHFAFYDENKNYISNTTNTLSNPFTTPANARYIRVSIVNPNVQLNLATIIKGDSIPTGYVDHNIFLQENVLPPIPIEKIPEIPSSKLGKLNIDRMSFAETINLYNPQTSTDGYFVNSTYGTVSANASYTTSDWIEVTENTSYKSNVDNMQKAFYDKDKKFISGTQAKDFTTPANTKYMRTSVTLSFKEFFMLCEGTNDINIFVPFGYKIKNEYIDSNNGEILVYLPPKIYVAVDRTIELYNNQVSWCGNINNYHFRWHCSVGKAMKRKFSITGQTDKIGTYPLKLYVYDNDMKQVAYAETTINIVNNIISSNKSVLNIGDSLSNDKPWYNEMISLSTSKLSYIGTKGKQAGYKHEGRSGFSARHYLTATPYTFNDNEAVHKFWDGSRFNYSYYKTQNSINPDIVQIFLGTNNIKLDPTENANDIKQMVDYIRQDDANIPIYVVNTLYMGNQDGIGVQRGSDGYASGLVGKWKLEEDRKVFNLMSKLNSLLQGYTNVHIVPIALTHDSEYNFGNIETSVNPRAVQKEYLPSEAVHPQTQGYMQFADCMYSVYCGTIA